MYSRIRESEKSKCVLNEQIQTTKVYHDIIVYLIDYVTVENLCMMILDYCIDISIHFMEKTVDDIINHFINVEQYQYITNLKNPYIEFYLISPMIGKNLEFYCNKYNEQYACLYYKYQLTLFGRPVFTEHQKSLKCNLTRRNIVMNPKLSNSDKHTVIFDLFDSKMANKNNIDIVFYATVKKEDVYYHSISGQKLTNIYIHKMFLPFYEYNYEIDKNKLLIDSVTNPSVVIDKSQLIKEINCELVIIHE